MTNLFQKGIATFVFALTALSVLLPGNSARALSPPGSGAAAATETSSTTTTDPTSTVIPSTYFGLTLQRSALIPLVTYGTVRSWDAIPGPDWADSNPSRGEYDFTSLDEFIAANEPSSKNKLTVARDMIYTLGRTPAWASSNPTASSDYAAGECAPPSSITDWDDYLTAVVTHAAGRIKYWELWNEPNNPAYYCGSVSTLVTLAQHARVIIKNLDPDAVILSPGMAGGAYGPVWFNEWLAAGGAATIDAVSFHGYWSHFAEDVLTSIAGYKAVMASNGISNLPMWDTEANGKTMPGITATADFLSKYYLLQWSEGVSRFLWYAYDSAIDWGQLWSSSTGLNAGGQAFLETYNWMVGAKMTTPCARGLASTWRCGFTRTKYEAIALWNSETTTTVAVASQYIQYRGLDGVVHPIADHTVPVGSSPILVETGSE